MKRIFLCYLLTIIISIVAIPTYGNAVVVNNGTRWLTDSQNVDGSWGTNSSTVIVDTSEVLASSQYFDLGVSLQSASAWLIVQEITTTDELSRRIIALAQDGSDISPYIAALINARNPENCWGYSAGYASTPLDTALALQALKSANYPDLTILNPALAYLTTSQNPDGGWGFYRGDASNVYMTAVVSATLQQFPQMTAISTAVSKATTWLLAHQNPDGGFGSSPSSVYETALAFIALVGDGQTQGRLSRAEIRLEDCMVIPRSLGCC